MHYVYVMFFLLYCLSYTVVTPCHQRPNGSICSVNIHDGRKYLINMHHSCCLTLSRAIEQVFFSILHNISFIYFLSCYKHQRFNGCNAFFRDFSFFFQFLFANVLHRMYVLYTQTINSDFEQ